MIVDPYLWKGLKNDDDDEMIKKRGRFGHMRRIDNQRLLKVIEKEGRTLTQITIGRRCEKIYRR